MIRRRATRGLIAMGLWLVTLSAVANVVPSHTPVFPGEKFIEMVTLERGFYDGDWLFKPKREGDIFKVQLVGGGHAYRRLTSPGYYQVVNPKARNIEEFWIYPDFQVVPPQDRYFVGTEMYYGYSWADFEDQCQELRRVVALTTQKFLERAAFVSIDLRDNTYLKPPTVKLLEDSFPMIMNCYVFIHHHDQFSRIKSRDTLNAEDSRRETIQYRERDANESRLRQILESANRITQRSDSTFPQLPGYQGIIAYKEYFFFAGDYQKYEQEFHALLPRQVEAPRPKQVEGDELQRILNQLSRDAQIHFSGVCLTGRRVAAVVAEFISQDIAKFESIPISIRLPDSGKRFYTMTCGLSLKSRQPRTPPTP